MAIIPFVFVIAGLFSGIIENPENDLIQMVKIPGGSFSMGSRSGREDERPIHNVTVNTFYMSKTAVTVGQFRAFINQTGYRTEAELGDGSVVFSGGKWEKKQGIHWLYPGYAQSDRHPVTCVSWHDCQQYIGWLNTQCGKSYRLPTEAEWEYAATSGGSENAGGDLDSMAWFQGNSENSTHPVGLKKPNGFGLYDMIGNIWEWCSDWYGHYVTSPQIDPSGPDCGSMRINRGGAWYGAAWECRMRRGKNAPDDRGNGLGFRLAASVL